MSDQAIKYWSVFNIGAGVGHFILSEQSAIVLPTIGILMLALVHWSDR